MRTGYVERSSVTNVVIHLPSLLNCGAETPRSSASVAGTRMGFPRPSVLTMTRWLMPYALNFFSSPSRNAIHFPSGLHSRRPLPRLSIGVSAVSADPGRASATKTWLDGSRSGSALRLLVKAMREPSGDQEGDDSSAVPF